MRGFQGDRWPALCECQPAHYLIISGLRIHKEVRKFNYGKGSWWDNVRLWSEGAENWKDGSEKTEEGDGCGVSLIRLQKAEGLMGGMFSDKAYRRMWCLSLFFLWWCSVPTSCHDNIAMLTQLAAAEFTNQQTNSRLARHREISALIYTSGAAESSSASFFSPLQQQQFRPAFLNSWEVKWAHRKLACMLTAVRRCWNPHQTVQLCWLWIPRVVGGFAARHTLWSPSTHSTGQPSVQTQLSFNIPLEWQTLEWMNCLDVHSSTNK